MKLAILIPSKGEIKTRTVDCLLQTFALLIKNNIEMRIIFSEGTLVTHVRNSLLEKVRDDKGITHAIFIDSDMIWQPQWILEMVKSDKDCVSGVALCRGRETPNIFKFVTREQLYATINVKKEDTGIIEIDSAGMSFFMFRREVMDKLFVNKKIIQDYFMQQEQNVSSAIVKKAFHVLGIDEGIFNSIGLKSEDIIFCESIRDAGYKIYANLDYKLGHIIEKALDF